MGDDRATRRLWRCAACGREFANTNQAHACSTHSLEEHFEGKDENVRRIFDAFVAALNAIGPCRILPEKTRIAFQVRMSFAQLTPRKHAVDGHLVLARRAESPLFRRIDTISRRNHVHHFTMRTASDLVPEFLVFLREAYAVGAQQHLTT